MEEMRLVVFDMDGVLVNSTPFFLNVALNIAQEKPEKYIFALRRGKGVRRILKCLVANLKGMRSRLIRKLAKNIPLTPGIEPTIETLKARGYKIAVISDGIDVVAQRLSNLNVDFIFYNKLEEKNGSLTGKIKSFGSKLEVLEKLSKLLKIPLKNCTVVGDDVNDLPLFKRAGLKVAYNPRSAALASAADYVIYDDDLRSILPIFERESVAPR